MNIKREAWLSAYTDENLSITKADIIKKFGDMSVAIKNWQLGLATETSSAERATFVARSNGNVVGYTSPYTEDSQRRIGALYVLPAEQGTGIGGQLLRQAVNWHGNNDSHDNIYLHVVSHNIKAIQFYEHFGFRQTGKIIPADFDKVNQIKLLQEYEMEYAR